MKTASFQRPDGRDLNLEVIRCDPQDLSRNRTPDRHWHAFHSIFFFQEGNGVQEVDFESFEIAGPDVLIIPEGGIHWEQEFSGVRGYVVLFTSDFFSEVQQQLLDSFLQVAVALRKLHISLTPAQADSIAAYCELLYAEQTVSDNQNQTFIDAYLATGFLQNYPINVYGAIHNVLK